MMDYYSVEITTNPDFNLDGMPDSDAEVYQMLIKINSLI